MKNVVCDQFGKRMLSLVHKGGQGSKAARKVSELLGALELGIPNSTHLTSNGESRISNCLKYKFDGGFRLVTVELGNYRYWLFIGDHNETDRWLDAHKGLIPALDEAMRVVKLITAATTEEHAVIDRPLSVVRDVGGTKISKYLPLHDHLRSQPSDCRQVHLTFDEINKLLQPDELPYSAYEHAAWWSNHGGRHVQSVAGWLSAGWKVQKADRKVLTVDFDRTC